MPALPGLVLALLALALGLGGCSLTEEQPADPGKRRPLKVQHARGETRVPFVSERPVTLDPAALETALALGIRPLGSTAATDDGRFPGYLRSAAGGVRPLGPAARPNVEAVEALDPDVIIGNELMQSRLYGRLARVAPTVYSGVPLSEWKSDVRFFGESLGRAEGGERLLIDWDMRAAAARRALEGSGLERVRVGAALAAALDPGFLASVLRDVGLPSSAAAASGDGGGIIAGYRVLRSIQRSAAR